MKSESKKQKNKILMDKSKCGGPKVASYFAVMLWLGWLLLFPTIVVLLPVLWIYSRSAFYTLSFTVLISALYPVDREMQPSWGYTVGSWIMHHACDYFSLKVEFEDHEAVDKGGVCIYALEPHGVLPVSIFWYIFLLPFFSSCN